MVYTKISAVPSASFPCTAMWSPSSEMSPSPPPRLMLLYSLKVWSTLQLTLLPEMTILAKALAPAVHPATLMLGTPYITFFSVVLQRHPVPPCQGRAEEKIRMLPCMSVMYQFALKSNSATMLSSALMGVMPAYSWYTDLPRSVLPSLNRVTVQPYTGSTYDCPFAGGVMLV